MTTRGRRTTSNQHLHRGAKKADGDGGRLTVQNNDFMGSIDIQTLPKRESDGVVIQCGVGRRVVSLNRRVGQTSDHFLNVANTLYTGDGRTKR